MVMNLILLVTVGGVTSRDVHGQTLYQTIYLDKAVNIIGGWSRTFDNGGELFNETIIDAEGLGRTLVITGDLNDIQIQNLTLINGNATDLGGGGNNEDAGGGNLYL